MELNKHHREAFLDQLTALEVSKDSLRQRLNSALDKDQLLPDNAFLEVEIFLAESAIQTIREALISNEIDF